MNGMNLLAVLPWVQQWLTPVWILCVGMALGVILCAAAWGGIAAFSRRLGADVYESITEGVLWPLTIIALVASAFAILGAFVAENPRAVLSSFTRIPSMGSQERELTVAAAKGSPTDEFAEVEWQALPLNVPRDELRRIVFLSEQNLELRTQKQGTDSNALTIRMEVTAGQPGVYLPPAQALTAMFPDPIIKEMYARNLSDKASKLKMTIVTGPPIPEVWTIVVAAVSVLAMFLLYVVPRLTGPRLSAVALATFKSQTAQPVFLMLMLLGIVGLIALMVWPFGTLGEDIKAMKKSGVVGILTFAILQAAWAASTEVAEEIEGRTALTVLSKPLNRASFIVGKFLGIFWTVALMFVIFGALFLVLVAYKPVFEGKEGTGDDATWQLCHLEMVSVLPALLLAFLETIVLGAISVAISTRLPMLANLVICFAIYVIGNLTPLIVQSTLGRFPIVQFFGRLNATIFPNLETFNVEAAVSGGQAVPLGYLGLSSVYAGIYTVIALLLALIMFEDRDVG